MKKINKPFYKLFFYPEKLNDFVTICVTCMHAENFIEIDTEISDKHGSM